MALTINFAPISLDGECEVLVGRHKYDKDLLAELRTDFRGTHVFRRDGAESMVDIPITPDGSPIGNVQETIDLRRHQQYWPMLLQESLVQLLGKRPILSHNPLSFLGARVPLIEHPGLPEWLQRLSITEIHTRHISIDGKRVYGIACDVRAKSLINAPCSVLIEAGIPVVGKYVQVETAAIDSRLMPKRKLVGRVGSIEGNDLVLDDHEPGFERLAANAAYLEPRNETFEACVRTMLGRDAELVLEKSQKAAQEFASGPGKLRHVTEIIKYIGNKKPAAAPGSHFVIRSLLSSSGRAFPSQEVIEKPSLVFDPNGSRKDDWAERGLKTHGPYDEMVFSPKNLNIAVVCQSRLEGRVDGFIAKFLDGMPKVLTQGKGYPRFGDGFIKRFRLNKPVVHYFLAEGTSEDAYAKASREALDRARDGGFQWDLAIVQIEEEFKSLADGSNPYYTTKSIFLKRNVPVQSVRLETMSFPDSELVFSMNHLSLATYAKLGGTPWLLAASQTVAHELVIGLGSSTSSESRLSSQKRHVGITTVFSSDGSYLLSDRTAAVAYERYPEELRKTLRRTIETVRTDDNWRSTDKVRLVFHSFKPFKDSEVEAIDALTQDLGLGDVTAAYLHIAPDHPFVVFDDSQKGFTHRGGKRGVLGPSRQLHIRLSDFESLVVFAGASELKQISDGIPRPALIKLHPKSTFKDMTYLSRQAFAFSAHSWRMLAPEPFPITIRYSDLIAQRLAGLASVKDWDPDAITFGAIGHKPWFL
ncbi:hypothetical protein G6M14_05595 [Agrobacterium tumefaciens]|uniref:argonaute/piwi family protein n=1 Tax=Agrobacterium tumefaciens TaxID=358 RepID=UPI001572BF7E|nr:hypothetical protein [Agrobacterium tumefaciens]